MNKRRLYNKNAYKFHRYVLSRKRNTSKDIVEKIECKLRRRFGRYKKLLKDDKLENLKALKLTGERKSALLDLYSYRSKAFVELRTELTTDENNRISNLCPYCLLEIAGTLDHIIPKDKFPEYSTNPYNLMPCCSTCNSKKNDDWKDSGGRTIINFYVDDIPDVQFLFAFPSITNGIIDVSYHIAFPSGYDPVLQKRLEKHFRTLGLLKRYRENSDDIIDELSTEIKIACSYGVGDSTIIHVITEKAQKKQEILGINYWAALLNIACVSDPAIYNYLKTH